MGHWDQGYGRLASPHHCPHLAAVSLQGRRLFSFRSEPTGCGRNMPPLLSGPLKTQHAMTTTALLPFTFETYAVRTLQHDGEPWFHAADAARALGYSNTAEAIREHVEAEDKQSVALGLPGVAPIFINEPGLYALIFGSRLESAVRFRRWVTKEVIPSIRRTGAYGANPGASAALAFARAHLIAADREIERRTQHTYYGSNRAAEHRQRVIAETAEKHCLPVEVVALTYAVGADEAMATHFNDPDAALRVEQRRREDAARRLAMNSKPRRARRRC